MADAKLMATDRAEAREQFERQFTGLNYSNVGRKELAIEFAADFFIVHREAAEQHGYRKGIEDAISKAQELRWIPSEVVAEVRKLRGEGDGM